MAFWKADEGCGVCSGLGEDESLGAGIADVLGGADDQSSGDETGIFSGLEHAREPVYGGVGVASAYAFDESAGAIIVVVTGIIGERFALNGVGGDAEVDGHSLIS